MTEPTPDLDERLARLAQRKANAAGRASAATPDAPGEEQSNGFAPKSAPGTHSGANPGVSRRTRRRHPAAAGRILSVGLSSSAFLSMIAAFGAPRASGAQGANTSNVAAAKVKPASPKPKIVDKVVHHKLYVDAAGHLVGVAPAPGSKTPDSFAASAKPAAGSTQAPSGGTNSAAQGGGFSAPQPGGPAPAAPAGGGNTYVAPPPSGGGSPSGTTPPPVTTPPSGGTTPPVTLPPVTTPPVTTPPVTTPPVTTPPNTTPPTAPPCTGSKCP